MIDSPSEFEHCVFHIFKEPDTQPCENPVTHEIYIKFGEDSSIAGPVCQKHCVLLQCKKGFKDVTDKEWPWD